VDAEEETGEVWNAVVIAVLWGLWRIWWMMTMIISQLLHRLADSLGSKEEDCLVIGDRFTKEKYDLFIPDCVLWLFMLFLCVFPRIDFLYF